ncbi:TatD family hydrolase [Actinocorallia sp. API 0066]|uniref:TatD family hydrolase n=1 Tax=Actinocorallia sp. API 0066 TaxID=2896846 RepID=UPI001E37F9B6|nr:TatD family hydrolase [Actinocorallia sp. API 0066]MCD0450470.1 TatD family hydrolase [Actinocorallia sp. API 0066]
MSLSDLPPLDCHAHIAPDVTAPQVRALNGAIVFAMTRSPAEASATVRRSDATILWGYGAHPGVASAVAAVTEASVRRAVGQHAIIGEIGLDRKTALAPQLAALDIILEICSEQPLLLSLHSTGRTSELLDALIRRPQTGAILHWFNGTRDDIERATAMGCYFSVNAAMTDERLARIPRDRLLPETDFPSSRRTTRARIPGDIAFLEQRMSELLNQPSSAIRELWYRNLATLANRASVTSRLPSTLREILSSF